ncbi:MAG: hypothetical protein ACOVSR_08850 [Bacteroidia bacterium]
MNNEQNSDNPQSHQLNIADVSGSLHLSKDAEIGLYEKYLDEFTDKDGRLVKCNPDAIFNWFEWQLWRVRQ